MKPESRTPDRSAAALYRKAALAVGEQVPGKRKGACLVICELNNGAESGFDQDPLVLRFKDVFLPEECYRAAWWHWDDAEHAARALALDLMAAMVEAGDA